MSRTKKSAPVPRDQAWNDHIQERLWDKEKLVEAQRFTCPEGMQVVDVEHVDAKLVDEPSEMVDTGFGLFLPDQIGKPSEEADLHAKIREWWMAQANEDVNLVLRKHDEYGDDTLATGGFALARLMGRKVTRGRAQEIAIWHDLGVKLGRLENALKKGEDVGDDTWQDIACYAMMGRRAQLHGGWPVNPDAEEV